MKPIRLISRSKRNLSSITASDSTIQFSPRQQLRSFSIIHNRRSPSLTENSRGNLNKATLTSIGALPSRPPNHLANRQTNPTRIPVGKTGGRSGGRRRVAEDDDRQAISVKKTKSRTHPIRKQFIFESYLNLFTANQVCLLFKYDSLNSSEWNSIRSKIKNLSISSSSPSITTTDKGSLPVETLPAGDQAPPKLEVLRTKMVLPALKGLLKQSYIPKQTFDSLVYTSPRHPPQSSSNQPPKPAQNAPTRLENSAKAKEKQSNARSSNLNGSLFSISQARFDPSQILRTLKILESYTSSSALNSPPANSKATANKANGQQGKRIEFVVGLIDRSVCKDQAQLDKFSTLSSLESSHSQILSLINQSSLNLIQTLNLSRGSQLINTLAGLQKTLESQSQASDSSPLSDSSHSNQATPSS